jgi:hypothetical protein
MGGGVDVLEREVKGAWLRAEFCSGDREVLSRSSCGMGVQDAGSGMDGYSALGFKRGKVRLDCDGRVGSAMASPSSKSAMDSEIRLGRLSGRS